MTTHTHTMDFKKDFTVEPQAQSEVLITGEIPYEELAKERAAAIKNLGQNVQIDGFRKGNVPEDMIVERVGEMAIMTEMAERALAHIYPHIIEAHGIDAIGHPKIEITKIAPKNPLGFKATVAVVPDITLPDYKALAAEVNKNKEEIAITDTDVDDQIKDILRQKVAYDRLQAKAAATPESEADATDATELPTPESEASKEAAAEADKPVEDSELPELTDDYVKTLGQPGQFETVADFKTKLREHLTVEKTREQEAKHRAAITDQITEATTLELPQILIDSEINQMFAQMEEDLKRANFKMDDYLAHLKKTKEELVKEWTPSAEKRATLQLVLNEIAKAEDVKPDEKLLNEQVEQLKEQYKDADEMRVKVYVASVMVNEAVMKLLEEQK